jgi:CAAD domains of cyanobacterial aminoacyl-tRNA synthetase
MEPELKQQDVTVPKTSINLEQGGTLAHFNGNGETSEQLKAALETAKDIYANLPDKLGEFLNDYRQLLITSGLLFGSIVTFKLTFALLAALNEIPLVQPSLELVGLGYSAWFIYRFVFKAENRAELSDKYSSVKEKVVGK